MSVNFFNSGEGAPDPASDMVQPITYRLKPETYTYQVNAKAERTIALRPNAVGAPFALAPVVDPAFAGMTAYRLTVGPSETPHQFDVSMTSPGVQRLLLQCADYISSRDVDGFGLPKPGRPPTMSSRPSSSSSVQTAVSAAQAEAAASDDLAADAAAAGQTSLSPASSSEPEATATNP